MGMRANLNKSAVTLALLLATAGTAFAVPLLPLDVGLRFVYESSDITGIPWPTTVECVDKVTYGSLDYYLVWSYSNGVQPELKQMYLRSTKKAVYRYNPSGDEITEFQVAPVGTKWTVYEEHDQYKWLVLEITGIETLTGFWGTGIAYKHHKYRCVNLEDPFTRSPERDEWVVPGVGVVKIVDDWAANPPLHEELVSITTVTVDITPHRITPRTESVTCNITLSDGPDVANIVPESLRLLDQLLQRWVWATGAVIRSKPPRLIVTFPISELGLTPSSEPYTLTVAGELTDGSVFAGRDVVTVTTKGGGK